MPQIICNILTLLFLGILTDPSSGNTWHYKHNDRHLSLNDSSFKLLSNYTSFKNKLDYCVTLTTCLYFYSTP